MKPNSFKLLFVIGFIFLAGCQIQLPRQRFDEIALDIEGDEDDLLRTCLIKHLAFAGYRPSQSSRIHLAIKKIQIDDRDMGCRKSCKPDSLEIKVCEADLVHSARVMIIDSFHGDRVLGKHCIRAWTCFDFASDRLNQRQLSYSRGALTVRSEARKFALAEARDKLANKIIDWTESILQKQELYPSSSKTALSEGCAEQIVFPNVDQNPFEDL